MRTSDDQRRRRPATRTTPQRRGGAETTTASAQARGTCEQRGPTRSAGQLGADKISEKDSGEGHREGAQQTEAKRESIEPVIRDNSLLKMSSYFPLTNRKRAYL